MKFFYVVLSLFAIFSSINVVLADAWGSYGTNPVDIVDSVKSNAGTTSTKLDISGGGGQGVKGTLQTLTDKVGPYIDWGVFLGMSIAVLLIIYNASLLVISPIHEGQAASVKKRIMFIAMGIVVMTGFYFIIKMILSLVKNVSG